MQHLFQDLHVYAPALSLDIEEPTTLQTPKKKHRVLLLIW
jgi:hypothetical protein